MVEIRQRMAGDLGADDGAEEPRSGSLRDHITTEVDVSPYFERKYEAVLCHDTQFGADSWVRALPEEALRAYLGAEFFALVHSSVQTDPADPDLLAGTR